MITEPQTFSCPGTLYYLILHLHGDLVAEPGHIPCILEVKSFWLFFELCHMPAALIQSSHLLPNYY